VAADNSPSDTDFFSPPPHPLFEVPEDRTWTEMRRSGESIGNQYQRCANKQRNLSSRSVRAQTSAVVADFDSLCNAEMYIAELAEIMINYLIDF
jgi:hypothetical protein